MAVELPSVEEFRREGKKVWEEILQNCPELFTNPEMRIVNEALIEVIIATALFKIYKKAGYAVYDSVESTLQQRLLLNSKPVTKA